MNAILLFIIGIFIVNELVGVNKTMELNKYFKVCINSFLCLYKIYTVIVMQSVFKIVYNYYIEHKKLFIHYLLNVALLYKIGYFAKFDIHFIYIYSSKWRELIVEGRSNEKENR